jgi:type I restriction enzyme S subunit
MRAWQGAIGASELRGIVSPAYVVERPRDKICARYFHHLFRTPQFAKEAERWSYGITSDMWSLRPEDFRMIYSVLPPPDEQDAIVRFLDHTDKRIRRFIAAKRRLIELLNEQKQAIIQKAVTRGLDPNVQLKPSGIKWLGSVPAHWVSKPAKYFLREIDERSSTGTEELLSVSHITGVSPRSQKNVTMFMAESNIGHKVCRSGDLVVNTMWAWMGAMGVSRQTGIVSPSYAVYRPTDTDAFVPDFLDHLLRTKPYISEYICRSIGIRSSRLRLYPEQFLKIPLIQPPREDQQRIIDTIEQETRELNSGVVCANREVELIREYRTRLIADVVTGKLDVRGAQLPPLEEAGELPPVGDEALDETADEETGLEPVEEGADSAD